MRRIIALAFSLVFISGVALAADSTLPALTADTTPASTDILYKVNAAGDTERKSTLANVITKGHGLGNWKWFYTDGSGVIQAVAAGAAGTFPIFQGTTSAPIASAFTLAAPGEAGGMLLSDGTNWTRTTKAAEFASPGAIGGTTAAAGSFTDVNASGQVRVGDSATYLYQPADGYVGLIGDTGIRLTASDEDLQILDNGTNNIAITSTTGVDTITFYGAAAANAMNLATTGTILGAVKVQTAGTTGGAGAHSYSPDAALMYGMLITIDDSDSVTTVNLPDYQAAAATDKVKIGASVCVMNLQAKATIIDPSADDKIRTNNGTLNGAGVSVTGPATIGAFSCFVLTDASSDVGHWTQMGINGAWPVTP